MSESKASGSSRLLRAGAAALGAAICFYLAAQLIAAVWVILAWILGGLVAVAVAGGAAWWLIQWRRSRW